MNTHYTFIPLPMRLLYMFPSLPLKWQYTLHVYWTNDLEISFRRKLAHIPAFIFSRNKQIIPPPFYRCGLQPPPRLQPMVCVTSLISPTICWLGARHHRSSAFWQIQTASVERSLSQGLVQYGWVESQPVLAFWTTVIFKDLGERLYTLELDPNKKVWRRI